MLTFTVYIVLLPPGSLCILVGVNLFTMCINLVWRRLGHCVSCLMRSFSLCDLFCCSFTPYIVLLCTLFYYGPCLVPSCPLCALFGAILFTVYIVLLLSCSLCREKGHYREKKLIGVTILSLRLCVLFGAIMLNVCIVLCHPVQCVPCLISPCVMYTLSYCHPVHCVPCLVSSCSLRALFCAIIFTLFLVLVSFCSLYALLYYHPDHCVYCYIVTLSTVCLVW